MINYTFIYIYIAPVLIVSFFLFLDTSEFIKFDQEPNANVPQSIVNNNSQILSSPNNIRKSNFYSFQWNSEPNFLLCIFPYVIGFASQSIEIRLLVNGSLVNTITMSNIKLISSKKEIFFSADHETLDNENILIDRHPNLLLINTSNINSTSNVNDLTKSSFDDLSPPLSPS